MWDWLHRARRALALAAAGTALLPAGAAAAGLTPTDDLFDRQWAMQSSGPLDAPEAWRMGTGEGQVVALLDTGVDQRHPDLQGQLWTNRGEVPGNGVDDDHDGYVDDVHGVDLVNHDGDPADDDGHGTHIAGIIAARRDGQGVVGLAPGAKIMAVKVLDNQHRGTADVVAQGIRYALAHGATVINTSVNADADDQTLAGAVADAAAAGVTIVASAGNNGRNIDTTPSWPASSTEPDVLAVAASDQGGLLAVFSNFGKGTVDLAAPGTEIVSTALGGGYEQRDGTSMAAPAVTATVALLQGAAPGTDSGTLRDVLLSHVSKPRGLLGFLRAGEVDPVAALRAVAPVAAEPPKVRGRVRRRSAKRVLVTWTVTGETASVKSFRVSGAGGRTLAVRSRTARGVWVSRKTRKVRISARDASKRVLSAVNVTVRR